MPTKEIEERISTLQHRLDEIRKQVDWELQGNDFFLSSHAYQEYHRVEDILEIEIAALRSDPLLLGLIGDDTDFLGELEPLHPIHPEINCHGFARLHEYHARKYGG